MAARTDFSSLVGAERNRRSWCPSHLIACKEHMKMYFRTCQSDALLSRGYNFTQSRHKPHATMITCLINGDTWWNVANYFDMLVSIVWKQFLSMFRNIDNKMGRRRIKQSLISNYPLMGCESAAVVFCAMPSYSFSVRVTLATFLWHMPTWVQPPSPQPVKGHHGFTWHYVSPLLGRWHTQVTSEWHCPGNLLSFCKNTQMMTRLFQGALSY